MTAAGTATRHVLDNPAYDALLGPHAHLAEQCGRARRYPVDMAPWAALPDEPEARDWADLAALAGPGAEVALPGLRSMPPAGWEIDWEGLGVQLVDASVDARPDPEAVRLGADDVVDMLDLVGRTQPGPFLPRTVELGTYLGIRREGRLVAMAGERMRPPGWSEISAVCTDEAFRGQGLGTRLVRAMAAAIRARGETPFLHAAAENESAIRLYEALGFSRRGYTRFVGARTPAAAAD
ncbi:GNAT family N-acetyltransferase [Streptomyces sp. KLOTTS4A1]|uniref:GNAT family N-acetyltransferase n=1 Tax=Streptomyces sp. KLOTTS4A1 TaxID=3390996 RepID=UPI0039F63045